MENCDTLHSDVTWAGLSPNQIWEKCSQW